MANQNNDQQFEKGKKITIKEGKQTPVPSLRRVIKSKKIIAEAIHTYQCI